MRLLDVTSHNRVFISVALDHAPDLEVLYGVSVRILGWALPGDEVGSEGRKCQFKDVIGRNGRNDMSD